MPTSADSLTVVAELQPRELTPQLAVGWLFVCWTLFQLLRLSRITILRDGTWCTVVDWFRLMNNFVTFCLQVGFKLRFCRRNSEMLPTAPWHALSCSADELMDVSGAVLGILLVYIQAQVNETNRTILFLRIFTTKNISFQNFADLSKFTTFAS
jgi:hypothetical protein